MLIVVVVLKSKIAVLLLLLIVVVVLKSKIAVLLLLIVVVVLKSKIAVFPDVGCRWSNSEIRRQANSRIEWRP